MKPDQPIIVLTLRDTGDPHRHRNGYTVDRTQRLKLLLKLLLRGYGFRVVDLATNAEWRADDRNVETIGFPKVP